MICDRGRARRDFCYFCAERSQSVGGFQDRGLSIALKLTM